MGVAYIINVLFHCGFWHIQCLKMSRPWNRGQGSLKVIENDTIQSGTHDFLLTFHSNHRPISHRFRDRRRFPAKFARKSPMFPTDVYLTPPLKGFRVEVHICVGVRTNWNDRATRQDLSFWYNTGVWRTDTSHPVSQPASPPATSP